MPIRTSGGSHESPFFSATLDPAEVLGLRQDYDALRDLNNAVMRVSEEKDREYEALQRRTGWWAAFAVVGWAAFVVALACWRWSL